jgi:hypothetical protein
MSLFGTLTMRGQRRRINELAAAAAMRRRDAEQYRRGAWSAIEARAKRRESLLLAFATGAVIAQLVPQQRRGERSAASPHPLSQNPVLRKAMSMAGTLALSRLVGMIGGSDHQ